MNQRHLYVLAIVAIGLFGFSVVGSSPSASAPLVSSPSGTPVDPIAATAEVLDVPANCVDAMFGTDTSTPTPITAGHVSPDDFPGDAQIIMFDLGFDPCTIVIPADTQVTLAIGNLGEAVGDFIIDELGVRSELINEGEGTTVTFEAPAGVYAFYSSPPNQRVAGRAGVLVAVGSGTPTAGTPEPGR